ncbi:MAG: Neopullulanase [Labilithrix sp.]|nr:Neopullulanase [Labilithrix sp.]
MSFRRHSVGVLAFCSAVLGAWALPACGSDETNNRDTGEPPDAQAFNPGNGGNGGYGYGNGPEQPFVCPDALKRCAHTITYPFTNETSVEVRGDFGGEETWVTGKPMTHKGAVWTVDLNIPFDKAIQFKFFVNGTTWVIDPAQPTLTDANSNTNNTFAGTTCDPAICEEEGQLPAGVYDWRDSVIYFTFVDRFFNGNTANDCDVNGVSGGTKSIANYQGGDWAGVTQKINDGYFNDLNVNTLWVTVPFDNPNVAGLGTGGDNHLYSGYHGYWPKLDSSDPTVLGSESCFGTFAELKGLVSAAHLKGLKVIFDYAMVHVHNSSAIYAQHNDWFWPNSKNGSADCVCGGASCSWETDAQRCWFTDYLPHWNYTNSAARDYSVSQAVSWVTQTGVDGFRADAIKHVDISWLTQLRAKIKSDVLATQTPPQRFYMVGETYDFGNRDLLKQYVDPSTKLDGQFDFPLRANLVQAVIMRTESMSDLASFMNGNDYYYGANAIMSTFIGNHDLPRVIHLAANSRPWGDNQAADGKDRAWSNQPGAVAELEAYERVANAFGVLYTNRGAPLVYYGDEIGLPGAGDPDNRRFMQWSGLDSKQTFLKQRLAKLGEIRGKHPALRRGTRTTLESSQDLWAYSRVTTGDTVYVAVNRSDDAQTMTTLPTGTYSELLTGQDASGPSVSIPPRQTRIFVAK